MVECQRDLLRFAILVLPDATSCCTMTSDRFTSLEAAGLALRTAVMEDLARHRSQSLHLSHSVYRLAGSLAASLVGGLPLHDAPLQI